VTANPAKALDDRQPEERSMSPTANIFANIPNDLPHELFETLKTNASFRIERIVSQGHASAEGFWYDQDQDEWILLLRGAARLRFEDDGRLVELARGDFIDIPAHKRHRVEWTDPGQPTVWLAIH
jgi:cupin 2 domain-containing protein